MSNLPSLFPSISFEGAVSEVASLSQDAYQNFKKSGLPNTELTLVDHTGRVLIQYDPMANGGKETVAHDSNVLLKENLATAGFGAATAVVAGKNGSGIFDSGSKKIPQMTGYAVCDGELGFAGLK